MTSSKPFAISRHEVQRAYEQVKAKRGAGGVDGQTIAAFERRRKANFYRIWNRMSSGSYFPPPVRRKEIPKASGTDVRVLGIPTVSDRIAQMVVKNRLEPLVEGHFHPDSYGYRPYKSALEAVGVARQRCWRYDWVVDVDIKGFFDTIPHDLLMRAVRKHVQGEAAPWMLLYIERWLIAPMHADDGTQTPRTRGTPQGGVISPVLANLFLHYAFDRWITATCPTVQFERYADDIIVHCKSEQQVQAVLAMLTARLAACGLELHPAKTKIVYCKDAQRTGTYSAESFDFLEFTFRPRTSKNRRGQWFVNFGPAISRTKGQELRARMRGWKLHQRTAHTLHQLGTCINPIVRGWLQYYGRYGLRQLYAIMGQLQDSLVLWATRKYKSLRSHKQRARRWLQRLWREAPQLFAHWQMIARCRPSTVEAG